MNSENDSLRKVIKEINSKYVFDSIAVRDIPDYKNTYNLNSVANGEIVFVGYNLNKKSNVILVDSFSLNPEKLYNPDTLLLKNSGYIYSIQLDSEKTEMSGIMKLNNKYGKSYKSFFKALLVTN